MDKDLLLRDFCSRLPYGVKVGTTDNDCSLENVWDTLWYNTFTGDVKLTHSIEDADKIVDISETKPYLFPLSSMTEEQRKFFKNRPIFLDSENELVVKEDFFGNNQFTMLDDWMEVILWLVKNHFDYRGLIPKDLAIDCTNLNIY